MKNYLLLSMITFTCTALAQSNPVFKFKDVTDSVSEITLSCEDSECKTVEMKYDNGIRTVRRTVDVSAAQKLAVKKLKRVHDYKFGELIMDPWNNELGKDFKEGYTGEAIFKSVFLVPLWLAASPALITIDTAMYLANSHLEEKEAQELARHFLKVQEQVQEDMGRNIFEIKLKERKFIKLVKKLFGITRIRNRPIFDR